MTVHRLCYHINSPKRIVAQFSDSDGDDIIMTGKQLDFLESEGIATFGMRRFHNESTISRGVANQHTFKQWDIYKNKNIKYVPYVLEPSVYKIKKKLKSAMKAIEAVSCIRFTTRQPLIHKDYIHFFKGQGCWSYIGRIGGEQMISIGPNCLREGVIIHEILHALGFFHEHSRPDRDEHITIDFDNLRDGMQNNFETLNLRNWFNMSIPYATKSVMHYSGFAFAKDRSIPSITYNGTVKPVQAQRIRMSILDQVKECTGESCLVINALLRPNCALPTAVITVLLMSRHIHAITLCSPRANFVMVT